MIRENFIPFRCELKLFVNGRILLNKHSKIPGGYIGIFIAVQDGEYEILFLRINQQILWKNKNNP